jgi:hypothetical protein
MAGFRRLWPALAGAVVLAALALDLWHRPKAIGVDFHTYEAAARVGLAQGWSHIYDQGLVDIAQKQLVPALWAQPFLSPPPVAWLVTPLAAVPYDLALGIWQALVLAVLVFALAWSTPQRGWMVVVAVGAAIAPWWMLFAIGVGQVAPLVAASILVAWRLARDDDDVAAGIVLSIILLKPHLALLAPLALAAAGRFRLLAAWLVSGAVLVGVSMLTLGPHGMSAYLAGLVQLPPGADQLTLHGALGLTGGPAAAVRVIIICAALVTAYRLRASVGVALALGVLASLLTAPYLHNSDLCMLVAAGWIVWHETAAWGWRALLAAAWIVASPFIPAAGINLPLSRWPVVELALLAGLIVAAWTGARLPVSWMLLTGSGDVREHAPA